MSVTNPIYQVNYFGTGTLGPYAITFDVTLDGGGNAQDINVQVLDPSGVLTDITAGSTITGMNVYTAIAYGATYTVVISRYPDLTQPYTFPYGTKFPSRTFESAIDRLCFLIQRLYGDADSALKVPIPETPPARLPFLADRANKFLAFDAGGDPIAAAGMASAPVSTFMATVLDDLTADAARTTLGVRPGPYIIAASDAPSDWKVGADVVMAAGDDLVPLLNAAVTASVPWVHLSPGNFDYKSLFTIASTTMLKLTGAGKHLTTITNGGSARGFIKIDSDTCYIRGEDFTVKYTGDAAGFSTNGIIWGQSWSNQYASSWSNVEIELTAITSASVVGVRAFSYVSGLVGCKVYIHDNSDVDVSFMGYENGARIANCEVRFKDNTATTSGSYGFFGCSLSDNLHSFYSGLSTTGTYKSFDSCSYITNCFAISDLSGVASNTGFNSCSHVTSAYASVKGMGFGNSTFLTSCRAELCYYEGFGNCAHLSACYATSCGSGGASAYEGCSYLSACWAKSNSSRGFDNCKNLTACFAQLNTTVGIYNCAHVIGCRSESNSTYGIQACTQCQQNYALSNTSGQYATSYADQASNACANTAAGGYNR